MKHISMTISVSSKVSIPLVHGKSCSMQCSQPSKHHQVCPWGVLLYKWMAWHYPTKVHGHTNKWIIDIGMNWYFIKPGAWILSRWVSPAVSWQGSTWAHKFPGKQTTGCGGSQVFEVSSCWDRGARVSCSIRIRRLFSCPDDGHHYHYKEISI